MTKEMKILCLALGLAMLASCGGSAARSKRNSGENRQPLQAAMMVEPTDYDYRVVRAYPHPTDAYTQGLYWDNGVLWEGTGLNGKSLIQSIDLSTGRTKVAVRLPRSEFGEGIARVGNEVFQLTWHSNTAHVYDATTFEKLRDHRYSGEGWGLTTDGEKLYMSDGTELIRVIDPATFKRERTITVMLKGEPVNFINEMEWIDGKIWANVYTLNQIVIIDPATGIIEGVVDLRGLLAEEKHTEHTDVLNGIAWDKATGRIWVTGKNWPEIYEIEIMKR